jgi:hypothetical protein
MKQPGGGHNSAPGRTRKALPVANSTTRPGAHPPPRPEVPAVPLPQRYLDRQPPAVQLALLNHFLEEAARVAEGIALADPGGHVDTARECVGDALWHLSRAGLPPEGERR